MHIRSKMKKKTHCWENSKIKFTPTEKIWRVGSGRKKKYFVAATIKYAYPFPKSKKKRSLACRECGTCQNTLPNYCPRPGFPYYNLPTSHREWEPSWS